MTGTKCAWIVAFSQAIPEKTNAFPLISIQLAQIQGQKQRLRAKMSNKSGKVPWREWIWIFPPSSSKPRPRGFNLIYYSNLAAFYGGKRLRRSQRGFRSTRQKGSIYKSSMEETRCGVECEGGRSDKFEDSVDFRSWGPQLFNHKVKLPRRSGVTATGVCAWCNWWGNAGQAAGYTATSFSSFLCNRRVCIKCDVFHSTTLVLPLLFI